MTEKIQVELSKRYSSIANEIERESDIQSILTHGGKDIETTMQQLHTISSQIQNAVAYVEEV